jgi:RsiW-degrading membrane proteinase PrsW (M82 family)
MDGLYLALNSIPAIFILYLFLNREKNKEPLSIVLSTFALTYIIVLPLDIFISFVDPYLENTFDSQHYFSLRAFFRAAFLEEFLKFSVIFLFVYRQTHFDELSDGIIYGIAIGLGYAVVENYDYLYQFYIGQEPMIEFIKNRWWALIAHVSLGILMGMFLAKSRIKRFNHKLMVSLSLMIPIFIHGLHNYTFASDTLYQSYVYRYMFAFYVFLILGSFIFLRKLETIKFDQQNNRGFRDFIQISFIGLIFSLILAFLFGFIK